MASKKYFGTDGVRGMVGGDFINTVFAARLGKAVGLFVRGRIGARVAAKAVIGRDTRASGAELTAAVARGLAAEGFEVLDAGQVPTPAVALAVVEHGAQLGVVITASHNPASDNGIKFFDHEGFKFCDEDELRMEELLDGQTSEAGVAELAAAELASLDARSLYEAKLAAVLPEKALAGWRIALDTAHGATWQTTPNVLKALGAEIVQQIGDAPTGGNINDGIGSEHPEQLAELVKATGAQLGIAHDGDGDRLVLCDETGSIVDGDEVLAMRGLDLLKQGKLAGGALVATVMSNLGLDEALEAAGGKVERVGVGDRNVVVKMREQGYVWGGESSGHFVGLDHSTTGDGLLAALLVIQAMLSAGKPLSELRKSMRFYPQKKQNLKVGSKPALETVPGFPEALASLEASLGRGRILLRYSGTEMKIRLLVEAEDEEVANGGMERLEALVCEKLPV